MRKVKKQGELCASLLCPSLETALGFTFASILVLMTLALHSAVEHFEIGHFFVFLRNNIFSDLSVFDTFFLGFRQKCVRSFLKVKCLYT